MLNALARDVVEKAESLMDDHYKVEGQASDGWL